MDMGSNVIERALKCGFEIEGIIKRHYLRDGKELDVAFMGLERG
jgi:RimJ/RimL family protein N-acetyltransferase